MVPTRHRRLPRPVVRLLAHRRLITHQRRDHTTVFTGTVLGVDLSLTSTGLARIALGDQADDVTVDLAAITSHPATCDETTRDHDGTTPRGRTEFTRHGYTVLDCRRCSPLTAMYRRQTRILRWLRGGLQGVDLVVVERPVLSRRQQGGAQVDRCGLYWRFVALAHAQHVVVCDVAPAQVKKFACDNGSASKTLVAQGMTRMWGSHVDADKLRTMSDDEHDALSLASLGAVRLRGRLLPVRILDYQHQVAAGVAWPVTAIGGTA